MTNKNLKIVAVVYAITFLATLVWLYKLMFSEMSLVDAINFLSICVSLFIIANALDFFIRLEKEQENPQETEKDDETTES